MYISCPTIAFQHLCDSLDFIEPTNQWAVCYPNSYFAPTTDRTDEEREIIQEMEDEDGCQAWRNDSNGTVCMCIDCMEECERDFDDQCIAEADGMFDTIAEYNDHYRETN